jgi:hypothetical protein
MLNQDALLREYQGEIQRLKSMLEQMQKQQAGVSLIFVRIIVDLFFEVFEQVFIWHSFFFAPFMSIREILNF